jgi:hypothetical protein
MAARGYRRMSLAMKRLKNLGWLALVFLVAIMLYPLSLNVAALHSDLVKVDRDILDTKREISFLQAELRTRASMQQLEEWNDLLYGYEPPTAQQFVNGEAALAGISGDAEFSKPVMMVAASNSDGAAPAGVIGGGRNSETVANSMADSTPDRDVPTNVIKEAIAEPTRTERLARIDQKLLSDDLMRDISAKAEKENKRK